ncbi:hypothetical protein V6N13_013352 [Hibiscus sabdariffa]
MGKAKDIELKGHTDSLDQLCWGPKHADLIATVSGDKTVRDDELTIPNVRKFKLIHRCKFGYEVLLMYFAYPLPRPVDTLMPHSPGCYLISKLCINFSHIWHEMTICVPAGGSCLDNKLKITRASILPETVQCSHTGRTVHQIPCRAGMESKIQFTCFMLVMDNKYSADEGIFGMASKAVC